MIYRMPAEWEEHAAMWLAWPHHKNDWPGKFEPIPLVYGEIIRWLTTSERVRLVVKNAAQEKKARDVLEKTGVNLKQVDFFHIPTNRVWLRDSGPIFVKKEGSRLQAPGFGKKSLKPEARSPKPSSFILLDWRFNAWAKYPNYAHDDRVPARIEKLLPLLAGGDKEGGGFGIQRVQPMHKGRRVVLEGGAIDVNGKGTLITTEECLLSRVQCRNPKLTREDYESVFEEYLGIKNVIWLGKGIKGDDTHGHVDDLARFVAADTVVTVVERDKRSDNYAPLADNLKRLKAARDQNGRKLNVVELPMPAPMHYEDTLLPASYANFLIGNKIVLVPTFNDPADRVALNILSELFPKREVIGIHAVDLVWGFGTLHCMSQQEPL